MSVEVNGIAHIQLTVKDPDACIPFWERLCHFMDMKTLIKGEGRAGNKRRSSVCCC